MDEAHNVWHDKHITGEPRFYPPGEHPALYRHREQLRVAKEQRDAAERKAIEMMVAFDPEPFDSFITYLEGRIAAFEEREAEIRAERQAMYDKRTRRREDES